MRQPLMENQQLPNKQKAYLVLIFMANVFVGLRQMDMVTKVVLMTALTVAMVLVVMGVFINEKLTPNQPTEKLKVEFNALDVFKKLREEKGIDFKANDCYEKIPKELGWRARLSYHYDINNVIYTEWDKHVKTIKDYKYLLEDLYRCNGSKSAILEGFSSCLDSKLSNFKSLLMRCDEGGSYHKLKHEGTLLIRQYNQEFISKVRSLYDGLYGGTQ